MQCYVPPPYREPLWFTWAMSLGKAIVGTIAAAVLLGSIGAGVIGVGAMMGMVP